MRRLLAVLLFVLPIFAQTPVTPPVSQTSYFAFAGAGVTPYGSPVAVGWVTFGIKLGVQVCTASENPVYGCVGGLYSMTTIEMTGQQSQVRTGVAMVVAVSGPFSLIALADGGSSTSPSMVGTFSGGGMLAYSRKQTMFTVGVKAVSSGSSMTSKFELGIGRTF